MKKDYIKISVPLQSAWCPADREWLWAKLVGKNKAQIANIPLSTKYGLGDIVRFNPEKENGVTNLVCRGSRTINIQYDIALSSSEDKRRKLAIINYLGRFAIRVEFMGGDMFSISFPLNMRRYRLSQIIEQCPEPCSIVSGKE